jgi:hypothetical protein
VDLEVQMEQMDQADYMAAVLVAAISLREQ